MEGIFGLIVYVALPVGLILLGYFAGKSAETRHLRALDRKEKEFADIEMSAVKTVPAQWRVTDAHMVTGCAVIALDYFKVFAGNLRNMFGGRMKGYEVLVERGRREAIVRMLAEARSAGAHAVWNVRIETATIGGGNPQQPGGVEVIAYGTALQRTGAGSRV